MSIPVRRIPRIVSHAVLKPNPAEPYHGCMDGGLNVGGLGRLLIIAGGLLLAAGVLLVLLGQIPFFGRLPGDIAIEREGFSFFFPLASMLILSLILTILINIILRFFR